MFVTPVTAKKMLQNVLAAGLVPFLQSSPGIGKSSIVREIAKEYNLELIDIRLAQVDPTELNGFPTINNGIASYAPMSIFPLTNTPLPKGKNGWLIFLDEMSSAPPAVQAAAYKLILDKMVGQHSLHEDVYIVAAGNLITDNAVVSHISTALKSRVVHIFLEASLDDFKEWAYANKISQNVISFLNFKPSLLHSFDPDTDDCTFPSPRTWEFTSNIEKTFKGNIPSYSTMLFQGALGNATGLEYAAFLEIQNDLIDYDDIIASPLSCRLPSEPSTQWSLIGMLVNQVTAKDLPTIMKFINRLPIEFQLIFVKDLQKKDKTLVRSSSEIQSWITHNASRFG